ncbi:uncharacterized protein HMPREF1541_02000 [Cyphellophora europaea CBS 101466]|uniref:Uncharacterized protein n=1 Tax=Cyphellophora europaea (strain CBS 101466) TaxID=1220924 RepID=W2S2E1_CYPE1|nr:uncharacterized protein HMPREF1541_02000 [Cyphellophora europaea CBS 101466]ETN42842.1 hypothetical protein HMPREF1541_02000 [Cyphellophora europaea CBS 101466]
MDSFEAHPVNKSPPIRRESKRVPSDLRELYRTSADGYDEPTLVYLKSLSNGLPTTPNLPPTPPTANGESAETVPLEPSPDAGLCRSKPVTPINQNSPPTPDITPPAELKRPVPRPFLGTQPSLTSTRAESFKTAREDIVSDDDSTTHVADYPTPRTRRLPALDLGGLYPSPEKIAVAASPIPSRLRLALPMGKDEEQAEVFVDNPSTAHATAIPQEAGIRHETKGETVRKPRDHTPSPSRDTAPKHSLLKDEKRSPAPDESRIKVEKVRRGPSLRDRLKAVDKESPSASTEKFASIIGWSSAVAHEQPTEKRNSAASTTSTIGALVLETTPSPKKRGTLRKITKQDSLRSASSPLPASQTLSVDSAHRLIHKKARLSNENRWSFGSEVARSHSLSSSIVQPKVEIIKVAVIPERTSSLRSSSNPSSKRHSLSGSSGRTHSKKAPDNKPPTSWQRKRTLSESQSDRGRGEQPKVVVPPRSSSLSAPTSRTTSRANSITSEKFRRQRKEAETELRRTLDRMESDRLISSLRSLSNERGPDETPSKPPRRSASSSQPDPSLLQPTPGTSEWAALRPPSILETPFSQPSYKSASPELRDATAVNFFPHNNHSLQLIEPNITSESRAVKEVRKQHYIKDADALSTRSPLRNPREAPQPPALNIIPATPNTETDANEFKPSAVSKRPSQRRRSESFVQALTRGLSVRNPQNRKKGQQLDGSSHPFWRPQGFWDSFEDPHPKPGEEQDMQVHNSLGLPQERTVIRGPVSLVRRISQRRRENQLRMLAKQGSSNSLAKIRASHQLYKTSILGINMPFSRFVNMRDRVLFAKQRKEDERRERRRQDIRDRIGKEVVRQGDSRFLRSQDSMRAIRVGP